MVVKTRRHREYSIPEHYEVKRNGSGLGIFKETSRGREWIYTTHPTNLAIAVSLTYNKIMIARKLSLRGGKGEIIQLTSWNKKLLFPFDIFDVLFGEKFLYLQVRQDDGQMVWALVSPELDKLTTIGEFEIIGRDKYLPYNVIVTVKHLGIKLPDGREAKLDLLRGEIYSIVDDISINKKDELVRVFIGGHHKDKLIFRDVETNKYITKSLPISEIKDYCAIFLRLMDLQTIDEDVSIQKVQNFLHAMRRFEINLDARAFTILYIWCYDLLNNRRREVTAERLLEEITKYSSRIDARVDEKSGFRVIIVNDLLLTMKIDKVKNEVYMSGTRLRVANREGNIAQVLKEQSAEYERVEAKITGIKKLNQRWRYRNAVPIVIQKRLAALQIRGYEIGKTNIYMLECVMTGYKKGSNVGVSCGKIIIYVKEVEDLVYTPSITPTELSDGENNKDTDSSSVKLEGNWIEVVRILNIGEDE